MEQRIGAAAGSVWFILHEERGALTPVQIARKAKLTPDLAAYAIGWLAREGKILFGKEGHQIYLKLKDESSI
ncbi:MAG: winged helix-turn-helix domain-containing protein [Planctomycetota bacterium]